MKVRLVSDASVAGRKRRRGSFFAIDKRAWTTVCDLKRVNVAVAYLVLARGSLSDMRTTAWSVRAIEAHTGVPRHLAGDAIKRLLAAGIVRRTRGGTRPLYHLAAPHEFPLPKLAEVTSDENALLTIIERASTSIWVPKVAKYDSEWPNTAPFETACSLVRKGHLMMVGAQHFGLAEPPVSVAEEPDWIWLPSSIVDGAASETAPVELLRQSQDLAALRLFVELYHAQSLPRHGGVHWRIIRRAYTREKIGTYGAYTVWGFSFRADETWKNQPLTQSYTDAENPERLLHAFWSALRLLMTTGLVGYVLHIVEADTDEAAVLFPFGGVLSTDEERAIGDAAQAAGLAMLTDWQRKASDGAFEYLVPLLPHQDKAVMVGLLRLRYQADTTANSEWLERCADWRERARQFQLLAGKAEASQSDATSIQYPI